MAPLEQLSQTTSSTASIMSVDSAKDASSVSDTLFSDHATVFALVDTSESLIRPRRRQRMFPALKTHRYDRGTKLEESSFEYTVRPVQTKYSLEGVPDGWEAVTHPEGCLYFYNRARKIYTEAWLCDPETLDEIEDFAALLEEVARDDKKDIPPDSELVLELEVNPTKETKHYWAYYYVDHAERVLFWLHEYVVSQELEALRGMQSASQIKYGIETYYWGHWEFFPIGQTVTEELRNEVLRNLIHDGVDQLTSASSTAGLTPDVTEKLISMIKTSRDLGSNQHTARTLGRLMSLFAHSKYHNYYGQQAARLDCNTSLFNNERNRSLWIISFAALLFKYPLVHLHAIEKVWIDGVIHEITWTRFVTDLRKEWREAIIASAVLLLANLSFLRIAVDTEASQHRTPAQTTSLVSMIACVSSVVLGMQLIRQYRVKPRKTALDAVTYLQSQEHPRLGMETLAIVYSLPYALCMWAIVTFMTALALECFYVQDEATIITTAVAWCLVAICATLCSLSFWQGGDSNSLFLRDWAQRLWNKAHNASRSLGGSSQREDTALTPNSSSGSTTELFEV
ncbi:hypothetical protein EVJ58_g3460 [Rhodofomes roseus]|uniref:WW domain-containing protein n=1 Tax=Rhodofomes roseus TaxID=34475 RepID=A0A4Y9YMR2_9APHY|nr:hypothetical protein EVJ58_g3460 [Rhodofomes roseus]